MSGSGSRGPSPALREHPGFLARTGEYGDSGATMRQLRRASLVLEQSITRVTDELVIEATVHMARVDTAGKRLRGWPEFLARSSIHDGGSSPAKRAAR